tara:strand:- start:121 stop:1017 length:897 start_codon:yes stop_codon:yes gene_type:complete
MLARAETDFELHIAIVAEQALRGYRAGLGHGQAWQQNFDHLGLRVAQFMALTAAVQTANGGGVVHGAQPLKPIAPAVQAPARSALSLPCTSGDCSRRTGANPWRAGSYIRAFLTVYRHFRHDDRTIVMLNKLLRERRRRVAARRIGVGPGQPAISSLQRLVDQAAGAFEAHMAAISVIEGKNQWFRVAYGVEGDGSPSARDQSFCTHTIEGDDLLEVVDPLSDSRFADSLWVTQAPRLRYYIGAPLRLADGTAFGALCVLDNRFHDPASADQRAYLTALARQVASEIEILAFAEGSAI